MKTLKEIEEEFLAFTDIIDKAVQEDDEDTFNKAWKDKADYYKDHIYNKDVKAKLLKKNPMYRFVFRAMEKAIDGME